MLIIPIKPLKLKYFFVLSIDKNKHKCYNEVMNKNHNHNENTQPIDELDIPQFLKDKYAEDKQKAEIDMINSWSASKNIPETEQPQEKARPASKLQKLGKGALAVAVIGGVIFGGAKLAGDAFDARMDYNDRVNQQHYDSYVDSILNDEDIPHEVKQQILHEYYDSQKD